MRASCGEDSRLTVSFHKRTEFGMCSRAGHALSAIDGLQQTGIRTFPEDALLGLDIVLEIRSGHPDLDTLTDMLHRAR